MSDNCCYHTIIDCCIELTTTADEFIRAMGKLSGMAPGGLMKGKRTRHIINNRRAKEGKDQPKTTKLQMAQYIIQALYQLDELPPKDHGEVEYLSRHNKVVHLQEMYDKAIIILEHHGIAP